MKRARFTFKRRNPTPAAKAGTIAHHIKAKLYPYITTLGVCCPIKIPRATMNTAPENMAAIRTKQFTFDAKKLRQ